MGCCGGKSKAQMAAETAAAEERYAALLDQQRIAQANESQARRDNLEILAKCKDMEAQMRRVELRSNFNDDASQRLGTALSNSTQKQRDAADKQVRSAQLSPRLASPKVALPRIESPRLASSTELASSRLASPIIENQLRETLQRLSKIDAALQAHKDDVDKELPRIARVLDAIDSSGNAHNARGCASYTDGHAHVPNDGDRYYCKGNTDINGAYDGPSPAAQQRGGRFLPTSRDMKPVLSPPPRGQVHAAGGISLSHDRFAASVPDMRPGGSPSDRGMTHAAGGISPNHVWFSGDPPDMKPGGSPSDQGVIHVVGGISPSDVRGTTGPPNMKPGVSLQQRSMIHAAGGISPSAVRCAGGPGYAMDEKKATVTDVPNGDNMCYGYQSPKSNPCSYTQLKQLEMDKKMLERQLHQAHHLFHQQDDLRVDLFALREDVNRLLTSLS